MKHNLNIEDHAEFWLGGPAILPEHFAEGKWRTHAEPRWSMGFRLSKSVFDYTCALLALPLIAVVAVVLLCLNPFFNAGPLFFRQRRIGKFGDEFHMWKFRSMVPCAQQVRAPDAKLEEHRITPLGSILRRTRIDELPNFFNVLRGEMSVIGPRPDATSHASHYSETIFGYVNRQRVKPGITGLAQVEQGYADDSAAAVLKARFDNIYVQRSCGRLDAYIVARTFVVILGGFGAR